MIFEQLTEQLDLLQLSLEKITNSEYTAPVKHLSESTIGGHSRHCIELLQCAIKGYQSGTVDYVNRERDLAIEQNKDIALNHLKLLKDEIRNNDLPLLLVCDKGMIVPTSYFREIVYNTEHIIHHLAIIKVALIELEISGFLSENFGLAYSTINYRQGLADLKTNN